MRRGCGSHQSSVRRGSYNVKKAIPRTTHRLPKICSLIPSFSVCGCASNGPALKSTSQWFHLVFLPVGVMQSQPPATPILNKPVWVLLYPYFFCSLSTNLETPWGQARVLFIFVSWTQSRAFIKLQGTKESLSVMVNVVGMGSEWESSQLSQMNDKSCLL